MTIKHSVTLPDGTIAKRASKTRVYTHVVIGQIDLRHKASENRRYADQLRDTAIKYDRVADKLEAAGRTHEDRKDCYGKVVGQGSSVEDYRGWVQSHSDRALALDLEAIDLDEGPARGEWQAMTWSMSEANAAKATSRSEVQYGHADVQVVPVTETREVKPRAKKEVK